MPMPVLQFTNKKDGRRIAWFREVKGRVRTTAGANWTTAEQMRELGEYGLQLQLAQCAAGLGSNGQPMPPLKLGRPHLTFSRENGRTRWLAETYPDWKQAHGLSGMRDLRGPGKGGHMLDYLRINFLDDKKCTYAITTNSNQERTKAWVNEKRAEWYGWSPASVSALTTRAREVFPRGIAEGLMHAGLISQAAFASAAGRRFLRRAA